MIDSIRVVPDSLDTLFKRGTNTAKQRADLGGKSEVAHVFSQILELSQLQEGVPQSSHGLDQHRERREACGCSFLIIRELIEYQFF